MAPLLRKKLRIEVGGVVYSDGPGYSDERMTTTLGRGCSIGGALAQVQHRNRLSRILVHCHKVCLAIWAPLYEHCLSIIESRKPVRRP